MHLKHHEPPSAEAAGDEAAAKKLTPKEAAERAGVSVSLIYQWCDERRLAHYRVGGDGRRGKILIAPADLDAFMDSLKVVAGGAPSATPAAPRGPRKFRHLS